MEKRLQTERQPPAPPPRNTILPTCKIFYITLFFFCGCAST